MSKGDVLLLAGAIAYLLAAIGAYLALRTIGADPPATRLRKVLRGLGFAAALAIILGPIALLSSLFLGSQLYGPRALAYSLLLIPAAVALNLALFIPQRLLRPGWRRWVVWVPRWFLTVFGPFLLVSAVEHRIERASLRIIGRELAGTVENIEEAAKREGSAPADILSMLPSQGDVRWVSYARKGAYYLLSCPVSSIDIDGGTLYYDPDSQAWARFHNDQNLEPYWKEHPQTSRYRELAQKIGQLSVDEVAQYERPEGALWERRRR